MQFQLNRNHNHDHDQMDTLKEKECLGGEEEEGELRLMWQIFRREEGEQAEGMKV